MALPNKTKIPLGTVLAGKYRVTREIGRGGMAAVYEAANVDIGKRVAIKVLAQELTTSAVVVERFLREARAAAAIRSPFICDIYDSGRLDDGRPFLVLELLEGESLYERMTKIRWLDIETTVAIISQVCRGLTKAHAANIVHRDLKPENIFLTKDEEGKLLAKIVDFGLAKFYTSMENDGPQARLTREGAVFGTPAYMSPEQVRGQGAVDARADLWALGCIVYECFTGRTVWSTEQGVAMTFAQIANAELPRPAVYRPDLPGAFTVWFDRALDRDITRRFQTAREFSDAFAAVFDKRPEVSSIGPSPALLLGRAAFSDVENPFLSTGEGAPHSVSIVPSGGTRQVAPDAVTEPPPPRTSVPMGAGAIPSTPGIPVDLASAPSHPSVSRASLEPSPRISGEPGAPSSGVGGGGAGAGPPSPRPSKLGFTTQDPRETDLARRGGARPLTRAAVFGAVAAVVGGLGFLVWTQIVQAPQIRTGTSGSASASGSPTSAPVETGSAEPSERPLTADGPAPAWMTLVREAQAAIAAGDLNQATSLLKDASGKSGGHGIPRTLSEHLQVAMASGDRGACRLTGLGRPRSYDLAAPAPRRAESGRPSIVVGPRGPVVMWDDAHKGGNHVWVVALDEALRDVGSPVDVTPEGVNVVHPDLKRAGDKLVLVFADDKGPEAGVHARFLDADGHIASGVTPITPPKPGSFWPSVAAAPNGSFFVAWTDDGDSDSDDLFYRRLGPTLEPAADVVRATDLVASGPTKAKARFPSIAVAGEALFIDYRLERDPTHLLIEQMRVPLADVDKGLAPPPAPPKKGDRKAERTIGDVALVNTDKSRADGPSLACGGSAGSTCFLVWHVEQNGGAWAASIDPASAKPLARWRVTRGGGHPAVGVSAVGQAQVVWFEGGKVLTAPVTRDGMGVATRIARIGGEMPMPSVAAGGKPGEWYLAWLDYEAGHLEPYIARIQCK
jgi:eukaryotic-like serine/threonine-protein kinase